MKLLLSRACPTVITINNIRSLERKLGVYKLVRLMARDRIILVDEGPVLAAHMFIYGGDRPTAPELAAFAETIPLPDAIVYVRAPTEAIVKRSLLRPDPPRELSSRIRPDVARYAEAATALFDQLATTLGSVLPILIVDNPDMDQQHQQVVVETVAGFILDRHLKGCRRPNPALNRNSPLGVGKHRTDAS